MEYREMVEGDIQDSRKLVFVIDDDETTLILAQGILSSEGFVVQTFSDSRYACAVINMSVLRCVAMKIERC